MIILREYEKDGETYVSALDSEESELLETVRHIMGLTDRPLAEKPHWFWGGYWRTPWK